MVQCGICGDRAPYDPGDAETLSIALTALITLFCYFASLLLLRRKVDKTDMIEALKDNRE
jgi:hypothetical protein